MANLGSMPVYELIHVYMDMVMHANLIKITDIYLKNKNEQIKRVYVYYFVTEFVKQRQL